MPRANAVAAFRDGLRRVAAAPWVWAGAWLTTVLLAAPLALVLREMIAAHLGPSLLAETVASGADLDWWQEFRNQATGLGTTFVPSILGFAAVLRNVSDVIDNAEMHTVMAGVVAVWLLVWSFLAGGILDRYARQRHVGASGFFAACGRHVWRLLRLGAVALLAYWVLFSLVHPLLFDGGAYSWLVRDLAVERQAFVLRVLLYVVFTMLLVTVNIVFDYARIRIVVEDRRSAIFALTAGARFVVRHWRAALGLYALNALALLAVVTIYAVVAPGAGSAGAWMWLTLLVGQAYIAARLGTKLLFSASQVSLFQGALAHAEYVAGPAPEWPDSPAAEAMRGRNDVTSVP